MRLPFVIRLCFIDLPAYFCIFPQNAQLEAITEQLQRQVAAERARVAVLSLQLPPAKESAPYVRVGAW